MSRRLVSCELRDLIAIVTIDNPPRNVFTLELRNDLELTLDELDQNKNRVRVVILTARGKAFIAGADIKGFLDLNEAKAAAFLKERRPLFLKLERFERPVICAINGYCLGAGLEVALCCDLRVAAETAKLGSPEVNVGIIPGAGGTQRLPRLIGPGPAKELIYTGRLVDAREAKTIGLVNQVAPADRLMDTAMEMAAAIAEKPPLALRAAKKSIDRGFDLPLEAGLDIEAENWARLCGTEDQKEGARAFLEKRKPVYRGK